MAAIWNAFIIAFVLTAAVSDLRWRVIPRALTTAATLLGLAYHGWYGGFWAALLATFLGFSIGLLLFRIGAIGGGDVKLAAALGAVLSLTTWARAMCIAVLVAGTIAVLQALQHRALRRTMSNVVDLLAWNAANPGEPHPGINVQNPATLRAPFGVAAALGTVLSMMWVVWR